MSTVFIFGANGFIGSNLAISLVKRGYKVYGAVRNANSAKELEKHEITPVVVEYSDVEKWSEYVKKSDVVIDTITYNPEIQTTLARSLEKIKKESNPSLLAIYTSGLWVYGAQTSAFDEHVTPKIPEGFEPILLRKIIEDIYANSLNGVVIQPSCVYGHSGSYFSPYFKSVVNDKGTFTYFGSHEQYIAQVHIDDLIQAYVLAIENQGKSRGQKFLVSSSNEKAIDIIQAISTVSKQPVEKYNFLPTDPKAAYTIGLSLSTKVSSNKIKHLLGWNPTKPTFIEGAETFYKSWKANLPVVVENK